MKQSFARTFSRLGITRASAAMLAAAALFAASPAAAQEPRRQGGGVQASSVQEPFAQEPSVQQPGTRRLAMPDTLSLQLQPIELPPLRSALQIDEAPRIDWQGARIKPVYPSIRIDLGRRPTRIYVINNIILQVGGYVNLTNGQAWIWSPYPNGFLDARTLSMPLPR